MEKKKQKLQIETIAVHAGHAIDPATGAVAPPIHLSTTFQREPDGSYASGYSYSRSSNPTRRALEEAIAALEGGDDAIAFGSGIAATAAVFQALAPRDHVIAAADAYHGTTKLLREIFQRWQLEISFVDMTQPDEIRRALRPNTKLLWVETPSNPLLKITDLAAVAEIARAAGAVCACDNTWAPIVQRPLDLGVEIVVHSSTKYFGGHSDVTGGVVLGKSSSELLQRVRELQGAGGAVPSPFDCWLVLRGLQTLPWRMRAHSENARRLAEFLSQHPRVERVHYPGLGIHPGHAIAARQMQGGFSGMLAFEVKGGRDAALAVAARAQIFIRATSLGGVESLIEHRASIKGEDPKTPQNLLRLSVGLENAEDLMADLDQALAN